MANSKHDDFERSSLQDVECNVQIWINYGDSCQLRSVPPRANRNGVRESFQKSAGSDMNLSRIHLPLYFSTLISIHYLDYKTPHDDGGDGVPGDKLVTHSPPYTCH